MTPENAKLITLARATLARGGGASAAAVRDETGRTHVAAQVDLPQLTLTALQAAVVVAAASGAHGIEAAVVATARSEAVEVDAASLAALTDVALPGCVVIRCDRSGQVLGQVLGQDDFGGQSDAGVA